MNYRVQEIIQLCIPGLYLLSAILALCFMGDIDKLDAFLNSNYWMVVKEMSNIIVILLPFVGFVVGYLIEYIMAFFVRFLYLIGFPRACKFVLEQHWKLYMVQGIKEIKDYRTKYTNDAANEEFSKAKQRVNRDAVDIFREHSSLARNIWGAQGIIMLFCMFKFGLFHISFMLNIFLVMFFAIIWYHSCCVYAKYVFADYLKVLEKEKKQSSEK